MAREPKMTVLTELGARIWKLDGVLHRDDGPAYIGENGDQCWYRHGRRHREDGPAIILYDGSGVVWFFEGDKLTFREWLAAVAKVDPKKEAFLRLKYAEHLK